ncbi:flagellar L-ring protein [Sulfuriferula plumbiphila]|uniref:Flagellar L-ring protein n=1 Tax=Sulfuriferula plumbiphila TaxID=171865 RepID=A0A512L4E4_9PROT|nr:flagellar basal body L-ring protein FlgH [Sulfuriferula plumbiphila]BBP03828.1 flagellar L-ring protein [Sulfuriferula plumbiphila]GEP29343.1 flagellar L-ring protein [Sulfuriferula plumbiphila]
MNNRAAAVMVFSILELAGCAVVPDTIVRQPTSIKPPQAAPAAPANGGIFQATAYRPLFEDRRARLVGDVLTIAINEKTNAGKQAGSSGSKTGSVAASIPTVLGLPLKMLQGTSVSAQSANKYEDKGAENSSNIFTGTITVTVAEVLPNGNLVVSGEKQVALDKGVEYIRFSGVVNPDTIATGNVVSSTQVADARVEYRTNSRIDAAQVMTLMTRFFLSVLPL